MKENDKFTQQGPWWPGSEGHGGQYLLGGELDVSGSQMRAGISVVA